MRHAQYWRMSPQILIWSVIAIICAIDGVLLVIEGMAISAYWPPAILTLTLCGLSFAFSSIPAIALLLTSTAQICAFSLVGGILTYVAMAASPFPMADTLLSQVDRALGFDWIAWYELVSANPSLHFVLAYSYASIPAQVLGLVLYFSYTDATRVHEFILAGMLSIILIVPIMVFLPAVGAWSQYHVGIVEPWRDDILALRAHTLMTIGRLNGIVSFPSFHTALGVLLANMARGRKWFLLFIALDLLLITSVMSEGAHYVVDMLSGLVVAFVALRATHFVFAQWMPIRA